MCGVFGAIGDNITKQLIVRGLIHTQSRGKDATGIYQPLVGILKSNQDASDFTTSTLMEEIVNDKMFISHCRQWTTGKPCNNENNHPFEGSKYVLVHNGTCPMMDRIENYPYKGECDSEIILSHIETHGFKKGLEALRGSASLLIAPSDRSYKMWIWRDTSPLHIGYNESKNLLVITSTLPILKETINTPILNGLFTDTNGWRFSSIEENEMWELGLDNNGKVTAKHIETIKPSTSYIHNYSNRYYYKTEYSRNKEKQLLLENKAKINNHEKTIINNNCQIIKPKPKQTVMPSYVPNCPDFGYSIDTCTDCDYDLQCRALALKNIYTMKELTSKEIITKFKCNSTQVVGDINCRTCPIRLLCIYEIEENWDETSINSLLPIPSMYPTFEYSDTPYRGGM